MTGPVNGSVFYDFVRGTLIPNMQFYDGENPNSIVIMDNCSIHHVQEVEDVIQQSGILLLFLPPYSPDLNPVEEAFSYIKGYMMTCFSVALKLMMFLQLPLLQFL